MPTHNKTEETMNYYAKAIELIVNLNRQLTDVEKYVAIHNPSLLVKALQPQQKYNVVIVGYRPDRKINCIKEIRHFTGFGLKEAKEASDRIPYVLTEGVPLNRAMDIKKQFEAVDVEISLDKV